MPQLFKRLFATRWLLHGVFWLAWYIPELLSDSLSNKPLDGEQTVRELLHYALMAAAVYTNLYGLLPRLFRHGCYGLYAAAVGVLWLGTSALGALLYKQPLSKMSVVVGHLTTTAIFLFVAAALHAYRRLMLTNEELRKKQFQAELELLQQQLNPHFFFNSLNSLYALSLANSPQTPTTILQLADLMRYMFDYASLPQVALQQEIAYLQNYVAIERVRLSGRADISLTIQGDVAGHVIAPIILLPFVENAFKHGVEQRSGQVELRILLAMQPNGLFFMVENSMPRQPVANSSNPGTGIANVRRRLELLYPNRHSLSIQPGSELFTASLHVQL
ncbi:sensor histidine kinase [Hymenobacter terrenus]|uniref:sensor histidine kinase n=1 Tax=Hymenobacter terrenus TaxID=1629124 RepID=UPI0006969DAC|nr:histidine kinase [Hymenobacter terrenus]